MGFTSDGLRTVLLCLRQNRTMLRSLLFPAPGFAGRRLHARRLLQGTSFSSAENRSLRESLRSTAIRSLLLASPTADMGFTSDGLRAALLCLRQNRTLLRSLFFPAPGFSLHPLLCSDEPHL
jgi:hypothetical protein